MNERSPILGILRGGAGVLFIQVAGAGAGFLGAVLLARGLGPYEYGRLAFGLALLSLLPQLVPLGLNSAMIMLIPLYAMQGDCYRVRQLIVWGTAAVLFAATLVAVVGTAAVLAAADNHSVYTWPVIFSLIATPAIAVTVLNLDICRSQGYIAVGFMPRTLIIPVLPALILLLGVDEVTGILVGVTLFASLLAGAQTWYIWRRMPAFRMARATPNKTTVPGAKLWVGWMRLALSMFVTTAAYCVLNSAHTIVLGMFANPVDVGAFQAAAKTAALVSMPLLAANALASPAIVRLYKEANKESLWRTMSLLTHLLFWPSALLVLCFVIFGSTVLYQFDGAYVAAGYGPLLVLSTAQLVSVGAGLVTPLLSMTGHHDVCAAVYAGAAISNIVLLYSLIPSYGPLGAAIGTAIPVAICTVTLCAIVRRRLGIDAHVFRAPTARVD